MSSKLARTFLFAFIVLLQNQLLQAQYCLPPSVTNTLANVGITNVQFSNLNKTTLPEQGFVDYTSTDVANNLVRGNIYTLSITNGDKMKTRAWIDWNQDGDFKDAGELVLSFNGMFFLSPIYTTTASVTIPASSTPGFTRMRVSGVSGTSGSIQADTCNNLNGDIEDYTIEIIDQNMVYDSTNTVQRTYDCVAPGTYGKAYLGVVVNTTGTANPLSITSLDFNTTGSTNPTADLTNAKLWFTGNSPVFSPSNLLGSLGVVPGGVFTFNVAQVLSGGPNYFWLTFDITAGAPSGDYVDVGCNQVIINSIAHVPLVQNPPGLQYISTGISRSADKKRTHVWYFGHGAGIDFNCNPPKPLTDGNANSSNEGNAAISDTNGTLLFYCNQSQIFNRLHQVMPNGTGIQGGGGSSSGGIIFVPQPGNDSIYYLFQAGNEGGLGIHTGFRYSVINRKLNNGLGDVVAGKKNILLLDTVEEKVTAVMHCNKKDVWIVTKQYNSPNFYAYLLSNTGIINTVISAVGFTDLTAHGTMKFSPDGKKLAEADWGPSRAYLYDFNKKDGTFCNRINLTAQYFYGISFSPDNSKLYFSSWGGNALFQFSQLSGTAAAINASLYTFLSPATSGLGDIELGPDGKIYVNRSGLDTVGVINFPNLTGAACNYDPIGLPIGSGKRCASGLPNLVQSYLQDPAYIEPLADAQFTYVPKCFPDTIFFNNTSTYYSACPSWKWIFGDPASGNNDTSLAQSAPYHVYSAAGTYTVTLILQENCDQDTLRVALTNKAPVVSISSPASVCVGNAVNITASGAANYLWSPSVGLSATTGTVLSANPVITTTYTVIGINPGSGCNNDTKTFALIVNQLPVITGYPPGATICSGTTVNLSSTGGVSYTWNPLPGLSSVTGSFVVASPTINTTYTVFGSDANGCSNTSVISITVNPLPLITVSGSNNICSGSFGSLTAGGALNYTWSPFVGLSSSTSPNATVTSTISTVYTITGTDENGCSNTSVISITVNPLPLITVTGSNIICSGSSGTLTAAGGAIYLWSPSAGLNSVTSSNVTVTNTISTTYTITATDANGCINTSSFSITVAPPPIAKTNNDTSICPGSYLTLTATGGSSFLWNTGESTASIQTAPITNTTYSVVVFDGACADTAVATVNILSSPSVEAGPDVTILSGTSIVLSAMGIGSITWSPETGLSCTDCLNPTVTPAVTTKYYVTITDGNGCTSIDSVTIVVDVLCTSIYIPTAFSPNNDYQNDIFFIQGTCIKKLVFVIFNRWGEKIFETEDVNKTWDGTYKGKQLDTDLFAYTISAILTSGEVINNKGSVLLLR